MQSAGPGGTNPQTPDLMRQQQTRVAPSHGPSHAQSVRITSSLIDGDNSSENGNFRLLTISV